MLEGVGDKMGKTRQKAVGRRAVDNRQAKEAIMRQMQKRRRQKRMQIQMQTMVIFVTAISLGQSAGNLIDCSG